MKIIEQSYEILSLPENHLQTIERIGRVCYQSEEKITDKSAPKFVRMLIDNHHEAMIEFGDITVKFITSRAVTHELVRHRLCSFAQESQRYVRYEDVEFIYPIGMDWTIGPESAYRTWHASMARSEESYKSLLDKGCRPEIARDVLPNATKTEIVVKANIREWRHIFKLRCSKVAHPQIRGLMKPLLEELKSKLEVVFDDII